MLPRETSKCRQTAVSLFSSQQPAIDPYDASTHAFFPESTYIPAQSPYVAPYEPSRSTVLPMQQNPPNTTFLAPPSSSSLSSPTHATSSPQPSSSSPPISPILTPSTPASNPNVSRSPAIGMVLADKTFICTNPACSSPVPIGRLADLHRHYNQQHAPGPRLQYFCRYPGCNRSRDGAGTTAETTKRGGGVRDGRVQKKNVKSTGKSVGMGRKESFGTRKDKRGEHERTVHGMESDDFGEGEGARKGKRRRTAGQARARKYE